MCVAHDTVQNMLSSAPVAPGMSVQLHKQLAFAKVCACDRKVPSRVIQHAAQGWSGNWLPCCRCTLLQRQSSLAILSALLMLNAFCTSYAEQLSKHAGRSMMLLVNGRHAWKISSLFGQQGSCGCAAKSHQHLIMLISQPACSEEMNSSCIFRLAATRLLKAFSWQM